MTIKLCEKCGGVLEAGKRQGEYVCTSCKDITTDETCGLDEFDTKSVSSLTDEQIAERMEQQEPKEEPTLLVVPRREIKPEAPKISASKKTEAGKRKKKKPKSKSKNISAKKQKILKHKNERRTLRAEKKRKSSKGTNTQKKSLPDITLKILPIITVCNLLFAILTISELISIDVAIPVLIQFGVTVLHLLMAECDRICYFISERSESCATLHYLCVLISGVLTVALHSFADESFPLFIIGLFVCLIISRMCIGVDEFSPYVPASVFVPICTVLTLVLSLVFPALAAHRPYFGLQLTLSHLVLAAMAFRDTDTEWVVVHSAELAVTTLIFIFI